LTKLPWIPAEQEWADFLAVAANEPAGNRVMLALAYDAALRREELCSLRTDDLDPAHRTVRMRAETTKNRLERVVPYSAATRGAAVGVSGAPRADQPGAGTAVSVGIPPQSRAAVELVDLVEGRPAPRAGRPDPAQRARLEEIRDNLEALYHANIHLLGADLVICCQHQVRRAYSLIAQPRI
jgi:hypothetical protein